MSVSWTYRLQSLAFKTWRRCPGPLRTSLRGLYGLWSARFGEISKRPPGGVPLTVASDKQKTAIVCFPIIDWEMRIQRPQQLLARLAARGYRISYVRKDFKSGQGVSQVPIADGITGLSLPGGTRKSIYGAPPSGDDVDRWLTALESLRLHESCEKVVSFVEWPFWTELALAARARWGWKVIYDCLDEHSGFPTAKAVTRDLEQRLIQSSDLVLTTSQALANKCTPLARHCERLANACDFEHFNRIPKERVLGRLRRPIIGYYGALADWFDAELIRAAALAHPEWQFVLVGLNSGADLRSIEKLANVVLLGERSYAVLPTYLHRFDVATIPFKLNDLTRAANPIKFFEYLSAGKPVVATGLPELAPYRHLFYAAGSPVEFTKQLEAAAAERDSRSVAARVAMARANTWDDRADHLHSLIREL